MYGSSHCRLNQFTNRFFRLLVEFSGMYLADRAAMELSDIFHGTLVTLSRRLGLFETTYTNAQGTSVSADETDLHEAVERESAKRWVNFGQICFISAC
jgi:hypothetical protein